MGKIKLLSKELVNQIAAGEIIESPSSALKELIENSIDAKASSVEVFVKNGGKSKIVVGDNGEGMSPEDLEACLERHATSKLSGDNLFSINSYGFRGEAIPSIASVSRFSIESLGFGLSVHFSERSKIHQSSVSEGTRVCVKNLFERLPVRQKFLLSDQKELNRCKEVVENFALTRTDINFSLKNEKGILLSFKNNFLEERVKAIYGLELFEKAIFFEEKEKNISLKGYLFHPSHSKYSSTSFQKFFVNNRSVKDKTASIAAKVAYRNLIDPNRIPTVLLFIDIDPFLVDVNVSPTKSEVRFRNKTEVQKFLIDSMSKQLQKFNKIALDFNLAQENLDVEKKTCEEEQQEQSFQEQTSLRATGTYSPVSYPPHLRSFSEGSSLKFEEPKIEIPRAKEEQIPEIKEIKEPFLGQAIAQFFENYIISIKPKTEEIFIIDQHAVHEKITLNQMKQRLMDGGSKLLIRPEIFNLSQEQGATLKTQQKALENFGFKLEFFQTKSQEGETSTLIVKAVPGLLEETEAFTFIKDLAEDFEGTCDIEEYFRRRLADTACHNSIRSGRKLSIYEMNELIRQMEDNKEIFQCNHYRPSFLRISKQQLEKMFERG